MRALGVDVGGSKLLACLADSEGRTLGRTVRETGRATGPEKACRLIVAAARELREAHGSFDVAGIGFPGQVDFPRGLVRASVMLDGWLDVALGVRISEALGVPCVVDNDVNAAAVAELKQRDDDPPASMLFVSVGTGIGGAITLGPHLWRGHTGVAGEIGNTTIDRHGATCWCGRRGCLNTCASGSAMQNALGADVRSSAVTGSDHHRREDIIQAAATSLGIGIANALNLLNPALVVLGGGVSQLGRGWLEAVAAAARREAFPEAGQCRFELALAGYEAGATGAAWLALEMRGASA